MNVASLELCKELYELSGWHDTQQYGYQKSEDDYAIQYQVNKETKPGWWWYEGISAWAAYDLGYLLRKLPESIEDSESYKLWLSMDNLGSDGWQFSYRKFTDKPATLAVAGTPENAACKLTIELFKQGILNK